MKINLQTLAKAKHTLEVQPSETILEVKNRIKSELNLAEPAEQKLIFVGKILKDDQSIDQCGITDGANIVIMVSKFKKPATAAAPATSQSSIQSTSQSTAATETPAATPSTPAPTASTPVASTTPATTTPAAAPSTPAVAASPATNSANEEAITSLMSFGFPREQVVQAMRAAFNNADRAAEYLFSGIPAGLLESIQAAAPAAAPAAAAPSTTASSPASTTSPSTGAGAVDFSALGDLTQLRGLLQQNPQMLPALLGQLATSHPELLQQLEENPEAFLELINALGIDPTSLPGMQQLGAQGGGVDEQGRHFIQINEEEQAQINNLISFGFPRDAVIEAWLLCDRNSEMAAAYLLEHANELAAMGEGTEYVDDQMQDQNDDDEDDFDPSNYME